MNCPFCPRTISPEAAAACDRAEISPRCAQHLTEYLRGHRVALSCLVELIAEKVGAEGEDAPSPERKVWALHVMQPPVSFEMVEV
jgi:hypothetical protein